MSCKHTECPYMLIAWLPVDVILHPIAKKNKKTKNIWLNWRRQWQNGKFTWDTTSLFIYAQLNMN